MTDVPDWVTMTDGEEVVWQAKPAIAPYVASLGGELILVLLGLGIWLTNDIPSLLGASFNPEISVLSLSVWTVLGLGLIGWGGLGILRTGLTWWSRYFVVTTEEIYMKSGLFSRSVKNTHISNVQNTSFSQSILGRLMSYGTVNIYTAGTGGREIGMKHVTNPNTVVSKITEVRSREYPNS